MREDFKEVLNRGEFVFCQRFDTMNGVYEIKIVRFWDNVYYFKYKNGKVVECNNLNTMKARVK